MILNGCALSSGVAPLLPYQPKEFGFRSYKSAVSGIPYSQRRIATFPGRNSRKPLPKLELSSPLGIASARFLHGEQSSSFHTIPKLPNRRLLPPPPRASRNARQGFSFPPMIRKPRFYWRILACIPYIKPFLEAWMYAETAYHLHPFLEDFELWTYPFLRGLHRLPRWFRHADFIFCYFGVMKRKEWPHFFRFHVAMGMLLGFLLDTAGHVNLFMPLGLYWGKIGMHFWTFFSFAFMFTVMECVRCAVCGMYADVLFLSDAAYIHIPFVRREGSC